MKIKSIHPPNIGWLDIKLNDDEMKHLWNCCEDHEGDTKPELAGNISKSQNIIDKGNWFWDNVLKECLKTYAEDFGNLGYNFASSMSHPYYLKSFWVNYQKETEFNPIHNHFGIYSFVIWMKIPTDYREQKQLPIAHSNSSSISNFQFQFVNMLGESSNYTYEMSPSREGTLLFFPSQLLHSVFPFYNCKEERTSISGNIAIDTNQLALYS